MNTHPIQLAARIAGIALLLPFASAFAQSTAPSVQMAVVDMKNLTADSINDDFTIHDFGQATAAQAGCLRDEIKVMDTIARSPLCSGRGTFADIIVKGCELGTVLLDNGAGRFTEDKFAQALPMFAEGAATLANDRAVIVSSRVDGAIATIAVQSNSDGSVSLVLNGTISLDSAKKCKSVSDATFKVALTQLAAKLTGGAGKD